MRTSHIEYSILDSKMYTYININMVLQIVRIRFLRITIVNIAIAYVFTINKIKRVFMVTDIYSGCPLRTQNCEQEIQRIHSHHVL